jgi:hypothetical protein
MGKHSDKPLPQISGLDNQLFWTMSFDSSGFRDSRPSERTSATAPEGASTIKTATHGFSIVTAADRKRAVQFTKTRDDGTTVTFQLCEGARGTRYSDLAQYVNQKLKGATLKTHYEFEEMVDELFEAVKGLMVADGELQTEDEALKLAFKIVQEGVRREGGGSWVEFNTEDKVGGRAVSGRRVDGGGDDYLWSASAFRSSCAFFGVSSPESK